MSDKRKEAIIEMFIDAQRAHEHSKYGELIIQSNWIQNLLAIIIFLRIYKFSEKILTELESLTLGRLIQHFRFCVNSDDELLKVKSLNLYKESRNALAHKMFTRKKLTPKECELSIELGREIVDFLEKLKDNEISRWKEALSKYKGSK